MPPPGTAVNTAFSSRHKDEGLVFTLIDNGGKTVRIIPSVAEQLFASVTVTVYVVVVNGVATGLAMVEPERAAVGLH